MTLKHTLCGVNGSAFVNRVGERDGARLTGAIGFGLHTTFSCSCGPDEVCGTLDEAANTVAVPTVRNSTAPPIISGTARALRAALRIFTAETLLEATLPAN